MLRAGHMLRPGAPLCLMILARACHAPPPDMLYGFHEECTDCVDPEPQQSVPAGVDYCLDQLAILWTRKKFLSDMLFTDIAKWFESKQHLKDGLISKFKERGAESSQQRSDTRDSVLEL